MFSLDSVINIFSGIKNLSGLVTFFVNDSNSLSRTVFQELHDGLPVVHDCVQTVSSGGVVGAKFTGFGQLESWSAGPAEGVGSRRK